jgi:cytosine/adenosine deaminase-related metal-dependent hydrolase
MADMNLTARWVFPVSGPPLERGVLMISDGRVVAAARHGRLTPDVDLGNVAIVPGFVNAHTHLDLTGARGLLPPTPDFPAWLRSVIAYRRTRTQEQIDFDIQSGIAECLQYGVTEVLDISVDGRSHFWLADSPLSGIVYHEIRGLTAERADASLAVARQWVEKSLRTFSEPLQHLESLLPEPATEWEKKLARLLAKLREDPKQVMGRTDVSARLQRGLSAHAPYSIRFSAIREIFEYSRRFQFHPLPIAIHVAETADEMMLVKSQSGPFVAFLKDLGVWDPEGLAVNVESIVELAGDDQPVLFVHANYLSPETRIPPKSSIVYCPRTHAAFGHPTHPFREFLNRGVHVMLGTDSLASNPDLSVLAEARFVASQHADFNRAALLGMATSTLSPGESADFVVIPLPNRAEADPHELLFNSDLPVQSTWIGGERVFNLDSAT